MGLFRRDRPIHEQLAEAGGVEVDFDRDSRLAGTANDTASNDWASNDRASNDWASNDRASNDRAPNDRVRNTAPPFEPEVATADGSSPTKPPDWHNRPVGPDGLVGRPRRWDIVTTAEAPGLTGDSVKFIAIPDGTLVMDEDEPDDSLAPLADAVEATVRPPYRAEAVRQSASRWSVAAVRINVVEAKGLEGEEAELVTTAESSTLTIDGRPVYGSVPSFERVGEAHGSTYVVRASRIDGDLWQVEAMPL